MPFMCLVNCPSRMCMRSPLCRSCTNGGTRTRAPARILVRLAPAARMRRSHRPPRSLLLVALPPRASDAPRRMPLRAARACDSCDSTRGPTLLATPSIYIYCGPLGDHPYQVRPGGGFPPDFFHLGALLSSGPRRAAKLGKFLRNYLGAVSRTENTLSFGANRGPSASAVTCDLASKPPAHRQKRTRGLCLRRSSPRQRARGLYERCGLVRAAAPALAVQCAPTPDACPSAALLLRRACVHIPVSGPCTRDWPFCWSCTATLSAPDSLRANPHGRVDKWLMKVGACS